MRKYALVVLDKFDKIIDRYNLDKVTNPTGNGFKLNLSTISSDIEDIITKVVQAKQIIKCTVIQYNFSYQKANTLAQWIQKYSTPTYNMALEYDDETIIRYCEGRVVSLTKTEKDEFGVLSQSLDFQQTTPYFIKRENTITIQKTSIGKSYPFKYPYSYGASMVENNEINNPYILEIPLIITIDGGIANPTINLLDANGDSYNQVKFSNETLLTGEQLVINSAQRKIYKISNGKEIDYSPNVDPMHDKFLKASSGFSSISINSNDATEGFKLTGGWREYTL